MNLISLIDQKVMKLFIRYSEEEFDIAAELMKEAGLEKGKLRANGLSKGFSSLFFNFLIDRLYSLCLKEGKIINSAYLIKNLPKTAGLSIGEKDSIFKGAPEIYPGIILHKDNFFNVLEKLDLQKTKQAYINWLIINDEEVDEKQYLDNSQIDKYREEYQIREIFGEEYEKKALAKRQRIIEVEPLN